MKQPKIYIKYKLLDNIHWVVYKIYGINFAWPYFHRLTLESIHECIGHIETSPDNYSNCIGQEQIIEHVLKIIADIFAKHNNNMGRYYRLMFQHYWMTTTLSIVTHVNDFKRTASEKVRITLWDDADQRNYDLGMIVDENTRNYARILLRY